MTSLEGNDVCVYLCPYVWCLSVYVSGMFGQKLRPARAGSIIVSGATVDRSKYVNGVFEPTDEVCNGMPVYQKKGEPDTWLEMVKCKSGGWRWYVKPTKERGADKSTCFG